jgi:hypothetical protein
MEILQYASQSESYDAASQSYLWCFSRLNMSTFVQRSVIARRTTAPVKMILTDVRRSDILRCGMPVIMAIKKFNVCMMLSRVLSGTYVYTRRRVGTPHYQIVILWNGMSKYADEMEPYHEMQMKTAFDREEGIRENIRCAQDESYIEEQYEEYLERLADWKQEHCR